MNPFQQAGAQPAKAPRYSPLFTNRFWTGLWTQRNPLRDAATQYVQEKYYGARYDSLIDGLNTEITNKLTIGRRPGLSVYNSQSFSSIDRFYGFRRIVGSTEVISVIADTASTVYDATGPSNKVTILSKGIGAGQTSFQSVGSVLFMGDGVEEKQWNGTRLDKWGIVAPTDGPDAYTNGTFPGGGVSGTATIANGYPTWQDPAIGSGATVAAPLIILDNNYNLQQLTLNGTTDVVEPTWATALGATTTDGTAEWTNVGNLLMVSVDFPTTITTYAYAFKSSITNNSVSTASPILNNFGGTAILPVHHLDGSPFTFTGVGVDTSIDPQVDTIQIYRKLAGGSTFFFLDEIPNPGSAGSAGTWQYRDTTPDAGLNEFIQAALNHDNDPPPAGLTNLAYHLNRIFGSVGNRVYYSGGPSTTTGNGNTAFPPANVFSYPSEVKRIWPMALGALVFTASDVYIILGQGTDGSPLYSIPFLPRLGLLSYNAFDVNGSLAYLVTTDITAVTLDPASGYSEVGFPIGDLIEERFNADNCYLAWHNGGSRDKALYLTRAAGTDLDPGFRGGVAPTNILGGIPPLQTIVASVLPSAPDPVESLEIYMNGVLQTEGVDYAITGTLINWIAPQFYPQTILAWYRDGATGTFDDAIVPTGTINGINTTFTLPSAPDPADSLRLYLNGIVQTQGIDYALVGTTITYLVTPPQTGDSLIAWYREGGITTGFGDAIVPSGTIDGSNLVFTLPSAPTPPESLMLFVNGVEQQANVDYFLSGTTIVFAPTSAPQSGDRLISWYLTGADSGAGAGWFRMNQTSAPETGLNWSPFAAINQVADETLAGCSAVQSIEVSPGIHYLLVGPHTSGPILRRDLSVYTDNGTPYEAYATIGSLVLAQPGQLAGVGFITTDCPAAGTSPTPSVWMDENSIAAGAPAGSVLAAYVNDPPQLAASTTFLGRRHYLAQTQEPAWCRSMQVKFAWPAVASPDELYSYTIFGNVYEEL